MNEKFRVLDLFSGIGGFSLGLERTGGFETVAFCEIEPYCRRVLAKHWPNVPCYTDVRELTADTLRRDGIAVDVICGGFPCQDVSFAGKRAGLEGARSGLWGEYARLIGELRPRFVIVENVPGLLSLGMGRVLGDLSALGFDAVWDCIPACAVGAPHRRDRIWIVAHRSSDRMEVQRLPAEGRALVADSNGRGRGSKDAHAADAISNQLRKQPGRIGWPSRSGAPFSGEHGQARPVADTDRGYGHGGSSPVQVGREWSEGEASADGDAGRTQWSFEPTVGRVAHGIPNRVDQLRGYGNAVVPQIPELIGRAILEAAA